MQYDWEFSRRIRCSSAQKAKCLWLVAELVSLAKKARTYGLLSLLDDAEKKAHALLQKGLQLIVDGEKPTTVTEILNLMIFTGDATGKELLEQCMILEGLTGIQNGLNPKTIKETLLAFVGEENARIYEAQYEESPLADMEAFLHSMESSKPAAPPGSLLEEAMTTLSDDAIELCLREISTLDLARALQGLSGKIQQRIYSILPKRGVATLRDVMDQAGAIKPIEVAEAHAKIEAILSDLNTRNAIGGPEASGTS